MKQRPWIRQYQLWASKKGRIFFSFSFSYNIYLQWEELIKFFLCQQRRDLVLKQRSRISQYQLWASKKGMKDISFPLFLTLLLFEWIIYVLLVYLCFIECSFWSLNLNKTFCKFFFIWHNLHNLYFQFPLKQYITTCKIPYSTKGNPIQLK